MEPHRRPSLDRHQVYNPNGVKAEQRALTEMSYLDSFSSYLHGISSYIPHSIKKQIVPKTTPAVLEEKDLILFSAFDAIDFRGVEHQCLAFGYTNGFQIWDLHDPENVHEILSRREGPIKCMKIIQIPKGTPRESDPFHNLRPLVAVASSSGPAGSFPNNWVKLYSLRTNEYLNQLKFNSEVYSIACSRRLIVVALKDRLFAFNSVTMEKVVAVSCYAGPTGSGVLALGPRWLAYPGNQPLALSVRPQLTADVVMGVATGMAKDIASGLYYYGSKAIQDYVYPAVAPDHNGGGSAASLSTSPPKRGVTPYDSPVSDAAGTVIVYDTVSQRNIAHFAAHAQPLSILSFDASGSLLVTASIDGHNVNVFQIVPNPGTPPPPGAFNYGYRHLYKLQRGITNAVIQDLCFSDDARWIGVNSSHGTTHLFAISPVGGRVDVTTHLRNPHKYQTPYAGDVNPPGLVALGALSRIKQPFAEDAAAKLGMGASVASSSAFVRNSAGLSDKLFVVSHTGLLTQYFLHPHGPPPGSEGDPNVLNLHVEPAVEWDVCRRTKWPELLTSIHSESDVPRGPEEASSWLAQVEIETHDPTLRPLWAGPQFTFKAFQLSPEELPTPPPGEGPPEPLPLHFSFYESAPTRKIDVRFEDPTPFMENSILGGHVYTSEAAFAGRASPGSPFRPVSEDVLKENMLAAINTPILTTSSAGTSVEYSDYNGEQQSQQQQRPPQQQQQQPFGAAEPRDSPLPSEPRFNPSPAPGQTEQPLWRTLRPASSAGESPDDRLLPPLDPSYFSSSPDAFSSSFEPPKLPAPQPTRLSAAGPLGDAFPSFDAQQAQPLAAAGGLVPDTPSPAPSSSSPADDDSDDAPFQFELDLGPESDDDQGFTLTRKPVSDSQN